MSELVVELNDNLGRLNESLKLKKEDQHFRLSHITRVGGDNFDVYTKEFEKDTEAFQAFMEHIGVLYRGLCT